MNKIEMSNVWTIGGVEEFVKSRRGTASWFSPANMRGFNTVLCPVVKHAEIVRDGETESVLMFVSGDSEKANGKKRYTIHYVTESGNVRPISGFMAYADSESALSSLVAMLKETNGVINVK